MNPSQLVAFAPREASQPGNPAQCPALKSPASAYEPPSNSSTCGYGPAGGAALAVGAGISAGSAAGIWAGAWAGAGAGVGAGVGACAHDTTHSPTTPAKTPRYFLTIPPRNAVASCQYPVASAQQPTFRLNLELSRSRNGTSSFSVPKLATGNWQLVLLDASGKLSSIPCLAGGEPGVLARQLLGRTGETPVAPSFWRLGTMNQIHGN